MASAHQARLRLGAGRRVVREHQPRHVRADVSEGRTQLWVQSGLSSIFDDVSVFPATRPSQPWDLLGVKGGRNPPDPTPPGMYVDDRM